MTFIRFTNDCQFFNWTKAEDKIILNWNMPIDLTNYKYMSVRKFQIGPLSFKRHDYVLEIYSNIIARTLYNPLRELESIRVSRNSRFIDSEISPGMFLIYWDYDSFVCLVKLYIRNI